jgi:general secretion pathway protein I
LTSGGRAAGPARGFTLIEVVVAFIILALSLGVLLQVFSTGLRNVRVSEAYTMAALLAESKLAAVGIEEPLTAGATAGVFDDRFRWRLDVQPYEPDRAEGPAEGGEGPVRAYEVVVTVSWNEANEERSVSLTTLRLAPQD